VIVRVVAYTMSSINHHLELFRMLAYIVTYHEEGRLDMIFIKKVKHPWGNLRNWTIIKGEIYGMY